MAQITDPPATPADRDDSDRAAIAALLHAETETFQNEDFEAWAALWVQEDRTMDVAYSRSAGLGAAEGWPEISRRMRKVFDENINCGLVDFGQENLRINLYGDTAWAAYESWSIFGTGGRGESFESRFLERHDDGWKIVFASFILRETNEGTGLPLAVDAEGRVVSSPPECLEALRSHPYLTISAGRLRAHRRDWDRALQAAIAQAARHHGFFETHKFINDMGGPADFPVILGQTDEGGVAVVPISIRDATTYVWVGGNDQLDRRLGFARNVFGLSEGQIRVARRIAMGDGLRGAADELGISVNTARTHLARLYDKTGVGTQAALVRLLLSVG